MFFIYKIMLHLTYLVEHLYLVVQELLQNRNCLCFCGILNMSKKGQTANILLVSYNQSVPQLFISVTLALY